MVGGGLCGMATALELAERGIEVVLLEAGTIGHGASGRNGGQIVQGFSASIDALAGAVGDADAQAVWDLGREAIDLIEERVRRHKINCDLRWGYFHAAITSRQLDNLRAEAITGDDSRFARLERIHHRAFPGGPLRTPALIAATTAAKIKDRLGM